MSETVPGKQDLKTEEILSESSAETLLNYFNE